MADTDFEQTRLGWFNSGLQLADRFGEGMKMSLEKQRMKSAEADRAVRQQLLEKQMAQIDMENQAMTEKIRKQATDTKAWLDLNSNLEATAAKHNTDADFVESNLGGKMPRVTREDLLDQGAVAMADNPHAVAYLNNRKAQMAMEQDRQQMAIAERRQALAESEAPVNMDLKRAQAKAADARATGQTEMTPYQKFQANLAERKFALDQQGKSTTMGNEISHFESMTGRSLSPSELENIFMTHWGQKARASAAGDWVDRAKVTDLYAQRRSAMKALDEAEQDPITNKTRQERINTQLKRVRKIGEELDAIGQSASKKPKTTVPDEGTDQTGSAPSDVQEVPRLTKDGRTAIYNAKTKAFIRYAD